MAQTHDIEDVLSSIRRLVANESGPTAKPRLPEPERADGPALVLQDSHRVTEPEDPFQMIRMLAQEERDGRDAEHLTTALPEELAAITSDLVPMDEAETWDEDAISDEAEQPDSDSTFDGPSETDVPSDYVEDTDYEVSALQSDEDADDGDTPGTSTAEGSDDKDPETGRTGQDVSDRVDETDVDHHNGDPSPRDNQPHAIRMEAQPKTSPLADLSSSIDGDDALRDLIAEIVRQELSGELGERITRNVRKLVRREIRQMLASDEFD